MKEQMLGCYYDHHAKGGNSQNTPCILVLNMHVFIMLLNNSPVEITSATDRLQSSDKYSNLFGHFLLEIFSYF